MLEVYRNALANVSNRNSNLSGREQRELSIAMNFASASAIAAERGWLRPFASVARRTAARYAA